MSVVRVKIQKDFTVLHNAPLREPKLSFKAKGLWAYCMTMPDDWEFHVSHLVTVSSDGEDSIYSALRELIGAGLVERTQSNDKKFGKVEYIIYPYPQEFKKCLPHRDFPDAGFPDAGNPALQRTDLHQIPKENNNNGVAAPLDDPDGIQESLKKGGVPTDKYQKALEMWKLYKEEIRKKGDNPIGYLIWMIKKDINPFKVIEEKNDRISMRKQWAKEHEFCSGTYSSTATSSGYEICSGGVVNFYEYEPNSEFWQSKGL